MFARAAGAVRGASRRHWRFVVLLMLVLLHIAAIRGVADIWARGLLLAHLGLMLLWQPLVRGEQQVSATQASLIAVAAVAVMLWLNWWLLAFWVVLLAGLVGGKVYRQDARWQRRYYLLMLVYLCALLAVVILPEIAPRREITPEVWGLAEWGLPVLFLAMVAMPVEAEPAEASQVIDFFYSVFLMLVLAVVALGSFAFMTLGRTSYLEALTYTVFLLAGAVLLVGLVWNPRTGYAGLNVFFSRYLFSIGVPLEKWLYFLAGLSQSEARPDRFLAEAVAGLARLPLVSGVHWRGPHGESEAGTRSAHAVTFEDRELSLTIWSRYRLSPALDWHLQLLGQLLAVFYVAKQREDKLRQGTYLQAVHETGARLTHDMKNLLQSLNVLCSAALQEEGAGSAELQALLRRQLPVIQQRLQRSLDRLSSPQQPESDASVPAQLWWDELQRQYRGEAVEFAAGAGVGAASLPGALFESVAHNLLQNAIAKRRGEPGVRVRAALECDGKVVALRVSDSGRAIAPQVAGELLRAPVRSATGLGIGLFQAARQAESLGYALALERNRDGEVGFVLRGPLRA